MNCNYSGNIALLEYCSFFFFSIFYFPTAFLKILANFYLLVSLLNILICVNLIIAE